MCGCPSDNVLKIGNNQAIFLELRANNQDSATQVQNLLNSKTLKGERDLRARRALKF